MKTGAFWGPAFPRLGDRLLASAVTGLGVPELAWLFLQVFPQGGDLDHTEAKPVPRSPSVPPFPSTSRPSPPSGRPAGTRRMTAMSPPLTSLAASLGPRA